MFLSKITNPISFREVSYLEQLPLACLKDAVILLTSIGADFSQLQVFSTKFNGFFRLMAF